MVPLCVIWNGDKTYIAYWFVPPIHTNGVIINHGLFASLA